MKKELGAILECKAEESSLKLVKDTKKSTEFEKDFIKASSNVGFQNVEDYLNEDIKLPENLKPLNFLKIKIGSKISNSENQYGHTANITGFFFLSKQFCIMNIVF